MATRSRVGQFEIIRKLGAGANAKVKLAIDTTTGRQVALKIMKGDANSIPTTYLKQYQSEIQALNTIDHPNVAKIFEVSENALYESRKGKTETVVYIAMELLTNGELFDVLYYTGKFEEPLARGYFRQIVDAVAACHAAGITHRDLKPENILFDEFFNLKLADFGFAAPIKGRDGSGYLTTFRGTETYMAPEILRREPYSGEAVDVFACGVILFILMSQHPAFGKALTSDRYYSMFVRENERFWTLHSKTKPAGFYSQEFKSLINALLAFDPTQRPTASEILQHPWVVGATTPFPEAQAILAQRHSRAKEKKRQETQRRAVTGGGNGHFRADTGDSLELVDSRRRLLPYVEGTNKFTRLFTHIPARKALTIVTGFFANKSTDVTMSEDKYKVRGRVEAEDGEPVAVTVELLDAGDGEVCVEVTKREGGTFQFMEIFEAIGRDFAAAEE